VWRLWMKLVVFASKLSGLLTYYLDSRGVSILYRLRVLVRLVGCHCRNWHSLLIGVSHLGMLRMSNPMLMRWDKMCQGHSFYFWSDAWINDFWPNLRVLCHVHACSILYRLRVLVRLVGCHCRNWHSLLIGM